jgi:hypothetical protein
VTAPLKAMWRCPECGRAFAARGQTHTCAALGDLETHFANTDEVVRACFDRIVAVVEPVDVLAEKSRIALHLRMSFAAVQPRRHWLDGHLVLARTAEHRVIRSVEVFSARNVLHRFRLTQVDDVDADFELLLREAREVGEQHHLGGTHTGW